MWLRFFIYGLLGWCIEIVWTALSSTINRTQQGWRLRGETYLWMFPIYGLIAPLYEPAHTAIRLWPWLLRGAVYALGFMAIEYVTGWLLRKLTGACPWDYTSRSRWQIHGLIRLDYAPLWALLGLALEPLHAFLLRLTPAIVQAMYNA